MDTNLFSWFYGLRPPSKTSYTDKNVNTWADSPTISGQLYQILFNLHSSLFLPPTKRQFSWTFWENVVLEAVAHAVWESGKCLCDRSIKYKRGSSFLIAMEKANNGVKSAEEQGQRGLPWALPVKSEVIRVREHAVLGAQRDTRTLLINHFINTDRSSMIDWFSPWQDAFVF